MKESQFLIGNMQRRIHACLSKEMSREHYHEYVFCPPWWCQIILESVISKYSLTSESIIWFLRNYHFSATTGNDRFWEKWLFLSNQKWCHTICWIDGEGLSFKILVCGVESNVTETNSCRLWSLEHLLVHPQSKVLLDNLQIFDHYLKDESVLYSLFVECFLRPLISFPVDHVLTIHFSGWKIRSFSRMCHIITPATRIWLLFSE
jgi:hypothetical protein